MICLISFSMFSDELAAYTCANTIDNLWSMCFGVNILRFEWWETLWLETLASRAMRVTWDKSKGCEANIRERPLPFRWLLKSRILFNIISSGFPFLGTSFLLIYFFLIQSSFKVLLFLIFLSTSYKLSTKSHRVL